MLGDTLLPRQELTLLGDHNVANALAASLAARAARAAAASAGRRAPHFPGAAAPARAGPRGGRRPLDQRLQGDEHRLDRGGARTRSTAPTCCCWAAATRASRTPGWRDAPGRAMPGGRGLRRGGRRGRARPGGSGAGGARPARSTTCCHGARGWPARATRSCSPRPAPVTTCSRNYEERGARFRAAVEALVTASAARRHPGELRWETRLLAVVTATMVVFGIAATYGAASLVTGRRQTSVAASPLDQLVGALLGRLGLCVASRLDYRSGAGWPGRCCSSRSSCC